MFFSEAGGFFVGGSRPELKDHRIEESIVGNQVADLRRYKSWSNLGIIAQSRLKILTQL